jgi:hypothetical protein
VNDSIPFIEEGSVLFDCGLGGERTMKVYRLECCPLGEGVSEKVEEHRAFHASRPAYPFCVSTVVETLGEEGTRFVVRLVTRLLWDRAGSCLTPLPHCGQYPCQYGSQQFYFSNTKSIECLFSLESIDP